MAPTAWRWPLSRKWGSTVSSKPPTTWSDYGHASEMVRRELKEEEDSLIVALTYRCNSRCHFCILEKELNHYADPDVAILEPIFRENAKTRRFRRLILSGAEVTLREDLADLAARATGQGGFEVVRIQTNGRRLSDPALARRLFEAGIREYFVSVHAHQAALDATITRNSRSFEEMCEGMAQLRTLGAWMCSNTVVCRQNAAILPELAQLLIDLGFSEAHFWSFLHIGDAGQEDALIPLQDLLPPLHAALHLLRERGLRITTKWFPRCLLGEHGATLDNHQPQLLIRDEFQDRLSDGFRFGCVFSGECAHFGRGCDGLHAGYVARYGDERALLRPTILKMEKY